MYENGVWSESSPKLWCKANVPPKSSTATSQTRIACCCVEESLLGTTIGMARKGCCSLQKEWAHKMRASRPYLLAVEKEMYPPYPHFENLSIANTHFGTMQIPP